VYVRNNDSSAAPFKAIVACRRQNFLLIGVIVMRRAKRDEVHYDVNGRRFYCRLNGMHKHRKRETKSISCVDVRLKKWLTEQG